MKNKREEIFGSLPALLMRERKRLLLQRLSVSLEDRLESFRVSFFLRNGVFDGVRDIVAAGCTDFIRC